MLDPAAVGTAMIGMEAVRGRERADQREPGELTFRRPVRLAPRRLLAAMLVRIANRLDPAATLQAYRTAGRPRFGSADCWRRSRPAA
jgi:hypothetical protein